MQTLTNSRFITYPSLVEKTTSHTVTLVDAAREELDQIAEFCSMCDKNYDIYIYEGDSGDLQYLNETAKLSDVILINDSSEVYTNNGSKRYGQGKQYTCALDYFKQYDNQLNNKMENIE